MEVQNANALPANWLVGPPPITAFGGMAHALALSIGAPSHSGFAIVHHDLSYLGDECRGNINMHQLRGASLIDHLDYSAKSKHSLSSQPAARCHMTVSMVVRFDADLNLSEAKIERFLRTARIAGGQIVNHQFSAKDKTLVFPRAFYSDEIALRIGSGFGIHERLDLMALQDGDADRMDPFVRVISRPFERSADPDVEHDGSRWIAPTSMGFAQVTPEADRMMVRNGLRHAYAEPLIGFIEYVPIRKKPLSFWQAAQPADGVFVFTTSPGAPV